MYGEGPNVESRVYVPPLLDTDEEDRFGERDSSNDFLRPQDEETGSYDGLGLGNTTFLPVWLRESSKSFRWGWVPLPLRKAGRATAEWVKGPNPPSVLLLNPLFPRIQELPVKYLERFFPRRKQKLALLLLLYVVWFVPWISVLVHSRSSGFIEGYGRPQTLSCDSMFWEFGNGCGLNGNDCRPFSASTVAFRCPASCRATKLLTPHTIGNETHNYGSLVVGGRSDGSSTPVYRADSFVCQAAIHAGAISDADGGCGVVKLEGAAHNYPGSHSNGIFSYSFPSTFPKSFSFVNLDSSKSTCPHDPRWPLLGLTIAAVVVLWLFCTSPAVLFFSTFFIVFSHTGMVSDPPSYPYFADLASSLLSRLLPASFVAYVLYKFCALPLLDPISSPEFQLSKTFLYLPTLFFAALNNYTFAKLIPLQRLTPYDIQRQPGAKVALALVIPTIVIIVLSQAWRIRQGGLMPRYLKIYGTMGLILLILLPLPGLRLRIHHYILAILFMPGTAFPTRPSLLYQGLLLGLFINGVARWGFASIIETPASLGETAPGSGGAHDWWGASTPNITSSSVEIVLPEPGANEKYHGNGNITFSLWEYSRMADLGVDGVTVLVNDVERWRGYLDEQRQGEFTWHRHGHSGLELLHNPNYEEFEREVAENDDDDNDDDDTDNKPEDIFFRFAFLRGAEAGIYSGAGVWLADGRWIAPDPPIV